MEQWFSAEKVHGPYLECSCQPVKVLEGELFHGLFFVEETVCAGELAL